MRDEKGNDVPGKEPGSHRQLLNLAGPFVVALAFLAACGAFLYFPAARVRAQTITVVKTLAHSPVVRVGERLTFTVQITNDSGFVLDVIPFTDTYRSDMLRFEDASIGGSSILPYDSSTPAGGSTTLEWNDLTSLAGDLPDGDAMVVTLVFVAEHPGTAIVNAAGVHDARDAGSNVNLSASSEDDNDAIGGSTPVEKQEMFTTTPSIGMLMGYVITVTNDGASTITHLPLRDTYDPTILQFSHASPYNPDTPPSVPGDLRWNNLADPAQFGPVPGDTAISITVYFTALRGIQLAHNRAEVAVAVDEYNNDLAAGADEVPITILGWPEEVEEDDDDDDDEGPNVAATMAAQATSTAQALAYQATATAQALAYEATATAQAAETATAQAGGPAYLPETGLVETGANAYSNPGALALLMAGLVLLLGGLLIGHRERSP